MYNIYPIRLLNALFSEDNVTHARTRQLTAADASSCIPVSGDNTMRYYALYVATSPFCMQLPYSKSTSSPY